ncbi:MAG: ABC transporter substrate-binding protein [Deltaproteobacteria bacterium]|nr:ABC transporter substrate-binding protein [Deltaproteobacteria bacterium]MBW2081833.1 ABC transporter substrate-binding protein [Deltaproteobacteria bacterium]HDM10345.1 ABC transporter substrate-binding protein [Desulfobacteraceae bacterium]
MKKYSVLIGIAVVVIGLFWAYLVYAGEPIEQIKKTTDKIIDIVKDPALKAPEKEPERRKLIRAAVDEIFDWDEMAKRTLGRHWRKRTEEEKKQFIYLFGKLLERTYLDKVEGYSGEKVIYVGDRVEGNYALVKVKINTKQETEIRVLYRMRKKDRKWMVYDISIEGVSLINNYRTQFNNILVRSSYKKLIEKLKAKVGQ